jgi:hypothetical protein
VEPPQSTAVSDPFFTVSLHVGAWHTLDVHTPLWQSPATAHVEPEPHLGQVEPPQSTAVSDPFFTVSVQLGA